MAGLWSLVSFNSLTHTDTLTVPDCVPGDAGQDQTEPECGHRVPPAGPSLGGIQLPTVQAGHQPLIQFSNIKYLNINYQPLYIIFFVTFQS